MRLTFVSNKAGFTAVQEVEAMTDVNFIIFSFNPSQLVHYLVPPFVHALVANVHLWIENPQETEPLGG